MVQDWDTSELFFPLNLLLTELVFCGLLIKKIEVEIQFYNKTSNKNQIITFDKIN